MSTPNHIVFIPDGNRRWAKAQGKPAFFGHEAGLKRADAILEACFDRGIRYATFWGCSVDNLTKRDPAEVAFLYKIFGALLKRLANSKEIRERGVKIRVLGRWRDFFPASAQKDIEAAIKNTEHNSAFNLTFLFAYNGNEEMLSAIQEMAAKKAPITAESLKDHLYTKELPPVDLVVRTGGDPHFSNGFMMWDTQNAELYFIDKTWPEFDATELDRALNFFAASGRRLGK